MNLRNKINIVTGILLLISLVSCSTLPFESPTVETNPNWVIFTTEQTEEIRAASWLVGSDDLWTPSGDDILKLEDRLAEYLGQNASQFYRQPPVWERLDAYQRQYIGLERGGRQLIYGNYFCDNLGIDWRQTMVMVLDGGECFFQVEYDVDDGVFILLLVNGES